MFGQDDMNNINNLLKEYYKNKTKIYGGATSKTINNRYQEHCKEDPEFLNMEQHELYKTSDYDDIVLAEKYLLKRINQYYKSKSLNDQNENGDLNQTGGKGLVKNKKNYYLYLLTK